MEIDEIERTVYQTLEKNQGSTVEEIVSEWVGPPVRSSIKKNYIVEGLLELIEDKKVFYECEKPSRETLIYRHFPYHFYTKTVLSENRISK